MAGPSIPDKLKEDLPPGTWGKILGATPVVMTVIATALAGLSSSEMNRAQFDRAGAAQLQAKVSDQWSFFQAKRLRSILQSDVADLMVTQHGANPDAVPAHPYTFKTTSSVPDMSPPIQELMRATMAGKGDDVLDALTLKVPAGQLDAARRMAVARLQQFSDEVARFDIGALDAQGRLRFAAARYDAESRFDQDIAYIYECQVRRDNLEARRHHDRSQRFFIGMLLAQMAVVIATFSLAVRRRHVLWTIAAAAGVAALMFSVYVYVWV